MRGERGHTHRHDGPLRGRQWSNGPKELVRPRPVHDPQDRMTAGRQPERSLSSILGLLLAFHEPSAHEPSDEPARRRG